MLYDKYDNEFNPINFTYFDEGKYAEVFKNNNIILKKYKNDSTYKYFFSIRTFDKLKELDLNSIVKLYDYYYISKRGKLGHILLPEAYTMEYIENPHIILLDQDKEYLLDIMSKLEKDINVLTKNKIKIFDGHSNNIIFQKNNAKIIDIDLFRNVDLMNYKKLLLFNKIELIYYIKDKIKEELKQKNIYNYRYDVFFFNPNLNINSVTDYLNNKLKNGIIEDNFKELKK